MSVTDTHLLFKIGSHKGEDHHQHIVYGSRYDERFESPESLGLDQVRPAQGIGHPDDGNQAGILQESDALIDQGREGILDGLGQDHIQDEPVLRHPQGKGRFPLAFIYGKDASPEGFRDIGRRIEAEGQDPCFQS